MKRVSVDAVLIFIFFLLQCTIFRWLSLGGTAPNLLLILTSSFALMRGEKEGMLVGFVCGILADVFFGSLLGFYAIVYLFIGYATGRFHMMFYDADIKLPMAWIAVSDLMYGLCIYVFMYLLRSRFSFGYYCTHIILPEMVYTVVVTIPLYRLLKVINSRLEKWEAGEEAEVKIPPEAFEPESETEEL